MDRVVPVEPWVKGTGVTRRSGSVAADEWSRAEFRTIPDRTNLAGHSSGAILGWLARIENEVRFPRRMPMARIRIRELAGIRGIFIWHVCRDL